MDTKNKSKRNGGKGKIIMATIARIPKGRTPPLATATRLKGTDSEDEDKVFITTSNYSLRKCQKNDKQKLNGIYAIKSCI